METHGQDPKAWRDWSSMRNNIAVINETQEEEEYEDGPILITIRLFKNKFSWLWEHWTDDKHAVSHLLQYTRGELGYNEDSKMEEVSFQNVKHEKWDHVQQRKVWRGTGEWYLDTRAFQEVHGLTPERANELLLDAFQKACNAVASEEGIEFDYEVINSVLE